MDSILSIPVICGGVLLLLAVGILATPSPRKYRRK